MNTKHSSTTKKIFALVFAVGLCFSSLSAPRVQAFWGMGDVVTDPLNTVQGIITAGSAPITGIATTAGAVSGAAGAIAGTAHASWSTIGKNTLDSLAYQAGQIALNQLTDNTIAWIRGGFHGSPSFNVDTQAMGEELADSVTLGLVSKIKGLAVCDFSADFKFVDNLTDSFQLSKKKKIPIKCPFDESVTKIHATFYASDVATAVQSFSWELFSAALDDAGNPYGVQIVTSNEHDAKKEAAKTNSDKKASWSNGYADIVDTSKCPSMPEESADYIANGTVTGAEITYGDGSGASISCNSASDCERLVESNATVDENGDSEDYEYTLIYDPSVEPATKQALQKAYCKTTTPGNIVSSQLSETLHLDMDRLGLADNLNKIISALLTVAVQSAIRSTF